MQILFYFKTELEFTKSNNRRLTIAPFCGRYVQLTAVSGQRP